MTAEVGSAPAPVYELTIAGEIGPVLRCALSPQVAEPPRMFTIVRTRTPADRDLVDLMLLLHSRGLDIEGIFETTSTDRSAFPLANATP